MGTRYLEGYTNPITFRGRFVTPPSKTTQLSVDGEAEEDTRQIFMANYPELTPGDILAQKSSGLRWRVMSIEASTPGGTLVSQRASVRRVLVEDIANSLFYPGDE
jgi:hypothetical protein